MTPMIEIRALARRFGATVALADVDLQVERGECLGLAGENGGGRSTLLRILGTLIRPSSGSVEIDGMDIVARVFDVRPRIAYAGDERLDTHGLRVREHLAFVQAARRTSTKHEAPSATIDSVLERAGLRPDAAVGNLSSGLRQRLELAALFLIDPAVLLLDDPFRAIDPAARPVFLDWLCEIRDRGTTIVVALNDDQATKTLCHTMVRLETGRLTSRSRLREPSAHGTRLASPTGISSAALALGEA